AAVVDRADEDRLQHALLSDRAGECLDLLLREAAAGLELPRRQEFDRQGAAALGRGVAVLEIQLRRRVLAEQGREPPSQLLRRLTRRLHGDSASTRSARSAAAAAPSSRCRNSAASRI